MDFLDDWPRLLSEQHGVVTRSQLLARGFTDRGIRAQVDGGRWQRLHEGVYLTHTGPPSEQARRTAALLACRGVALLSHETAAELHGMVPADPTRPIHTTVPFGTSALRHDGLLVHRSRAFAHIAAAGLEPPRTSRVHTVLDLAVAAQDAEAAMRLTHRLAVDGNVDPGALERATELRRPARYRRAIRDAITLLRGGVDSELELRYALDVEEEHGLPAGSRQEPVLVDGRKLYEDVAYDLPGGRASVRLDGYRWHRDRATAVTDRRRSVAATVSGVPSLPFGWDEIVGASCRTAREVETVLRLHGWTGAFRQCPRCPCVNSYAMT